MSPFVKWFEKFALPYNVAAMGKCDTGFNFFIQRTFGIALS